MAGINPPARQSKIAPLLVTAAYIRRQISSSTTLIIAPVAFPETTYDNAPNRCRISGISPRVLASGRRKPPNDSVTFTRSVMQSPAIERRKPPDRCDLATTKIPDSLSLWERAGVRVCPEPFSLSMTSPSPILHIPSLDRQCATKLAHQLFFCQHTYYILYASRRDLLPVVGSSLPTSS
jgi:hypothetical protein